MTTGTEGSDDTIDVAPASLVDALLVYVEPLASDAHAVVIGDSESSIADRLLELGARGVHVFDPDPARAANAARAGAPRGVTVRALVDDLDVRDGAFDLAVVPDLAELDDARGMIARLRRAVTSSGAVVAMGRAELDEEEAAEGEIPFEAELGPATLAYGELYDLFAAQFEDVSLAGVVPFAGVVFAELGGTEDEAPAVSVDTRLAPSSAPSVFVVVASQSAPGEVRGDRRRRRPALDPYAIVQISEPEAGPREETIALEAAFAATQLKAELLSAQLEEARDRLIAADGRTSEAVSRLDRASSERDSALTRAMELETVLAASQQTMASLEQRLLEAERAMLERDERLVALSSDLDARRLVEVPTAPAEVIDISELVTRAERAEGALAAALADIAAREEAAATHVDTNAIVARAERAEAELALNVADLAHVAEAHAAETAAYEEQLRDRARFVAELEKELVRREQLVKELVTSLEESREGLATPVVFEAAAPLPLPPPPRPGPDPAAVAEMARLRSKLDELASEVARREGELTARAWRITELENERARLLAEAEKAAEPSAVAEAPGEEGGAREAEAELVRALNELDALRQALAQEHAARIAAESGEELARARSELARQAALLEQVRGRVETS